MRKSPFFYFATTHRKVDGNVKEFVLKQTKFDTFDAEYIIKKKLKTRYKYLEN